MLQLTSAASPEMTARRLRMVRPKLDRTIGQKQIPGGRERRVAARRGDAIALGGDAHDFLAVAHSAAA
jgi:hypothetical protein